MAETPATETPAAKWTGMYARGFTPWDTRRPSSQLHAYLTTCPADWPRDDGGAVLPAPAPGAPLETAAGGAGASQAGGAAAPCSPPAAAAAAVPPLGVAPAYHRCPRCARLKPPAGGAALEIGCGTGASSVHLARAGLRVVGVDVVPAAAAAARRLAAAAGVAGRCAFVVADALRLPAGFGWGAAKRMEREQLAAGEAGAGGEMTPLAAAAPAAAEVQAAAEAGESSGGKDGGSGGFDLIVDCQTFHVLWEQQDRAGAAPALARLLAPGGGVMLLTGNAEEPECGPAVLSEAQLRDAFAEADGWRWGWLLRSRFDETPHYRDVLGKRPLAWWGMAQRPGTQAGGNSGAEGG